MRFLDASMLTKSEIQTTNEISRFFKQPMTCLAASWLTESIIQRTNEIPWFFMDDRIWNSKNQWDSLMLYGWMNLKLKEPMRFLDSSCRMNLKFKEPIKHHHKCILELQSRYWNATYLQIYAIIETWNILKSKLTKLRYNWKLKYLKIKLTT